MTTQTVYVVQEIYWLYNDQEYSRDGNQPIKAFTSWEAAETERMTEEWKVRRELMEIRSHGGTWSCNLFYTFGSLASLTSLSPEQFQESVEGMGLYIYSTALPARSYEDTFYGDDMSDYCDDEYWVASDEWWINAWNTLQPDHTELLWNLLDRLRFYEVVAVEVTE